MPDDWEIAHGLNPNDPKDANQDRDHDRYTNIEEYINNLARREIVVAADGTGNFKSVQAAIDSIPDGNRQRIVIAIKEGVYRDQLRIEKSFLTLRGADRKRTKIEFEIDTSACKIPGSVEENCTSVRVDASDVSIENLTVENPVAGKGKSAALSIVGSSTRVAVRNADIIGAGGDTLALTSRGKFYLNNVYVSGTYHIIVPRGSAYFTNCTFWCLGHKTCLFNEGITNETDKLVIRDSCIGGPSPFGLGSYFRDAAWYFIDNEFSATMLPEAIFRQPAKNYQLKWGEDRIYFSGNKGPGYAWMKDNLDKSPAGKKSRVTAAWALVDWDPEKEQ